MRDTKIRDAFGRIKQDMGFLKKEIENLKKANELSADIKKQINNLKSFDLEKFVINMENEFKSINELLKTFNSNFQNNHQLISELSKELEKYNLEVKEMKSKVSSTQNRSENTHLDLEMLEEKFAEFQELINEKVSMEISSVKLEKDEKLAEMDAKLNKFLKNNSIEPEVIYELNEVLNEKISLETSSLRMEFSEEIAKLYDRLGEKKIEKKPVKKTTLKKENKEYEVEEIAEEDEKAAKKNESKIKKVAKWLFVDDEEEFDSIKDEVKKGKGK